MDYAQDLRSIHPELSLAFDEWKPIRKMGTVVRAQGRQLKRNAICIPVTKVNPNADFCKTQLFEHPNVIHGAHNHDALCIGEHHRILAPKDIEQQAVYLYEGDMANEPHIGADKDVMDNLVSYRTMSSSLGFNG